MNSDNMKIVFTFTETKTHTLTMSKENGWDMPKTYNELVDLVNSTSDRPNLFARESECETTVDFEFNGVDIQE